MLFGFVLWTCAGTRLEFAAEPREVLEAKGEAEAVRGGGVGEAEVIACRRSASRGSNQEG